MVNENAPTSTPASEPAEDPLRVDLSGGAKTGKEGASVAVLYDFNGFKARGVTEERARALEAFVQRFALAYADSFRVNMGLLFTAISAEAADDVLPHLNNFVASMNASTAEASKMAERVMKGLPAQPRVLTAIRGGKAKPWFDEPTKRRPT